MLPPAQPEVSDVGNPAAQDGTVTGNYTVTGTWEESNADAGALPRTGANAAGLGVAGLLLVGAGLGLRRAVRGQAD